MPKISKQIFQGHATDIMSIPMSFFLSFLVSFKTTLLLCLFLLLFSHLNFDFTNFTVWYSIKYLENLNWADLLLAKLGKPCLRRNF